MAPVKIKHVVSFSSQDPKHSVDALLAKEAVRPWLCAPKDHSGLMKVELQLERATAIGYIDIGNCGSAFIQIDVGRSSWPQDQPYMTLLPTVTLMSPTESRQGTNRTGVRMFKEGDFLSQGDGELWDRVRVTCSQPFNKHVQFGLSFLQIRTPLDHNENEVLSDGTEMQMSPGQLGASQTREWLSSPTMQSTFIGQTQGGCSAEPVQARLQLVDRSSCVRFRDGVCLSRSARMVISASRSKRHPPAWPSTDTASCGEGGHLEGTEQTAKESHTDPESRVADVTPAVATRKRPIKRRCPWGSGGRSSLISRSTQSRSSGSTKRQMTVSGKGTSLPPSISETPELPIEGDVETGLPESCCPICGECFSLDYLPVHASSCQGDEFAVPLDVESSYGPPQSPLRSSPEKLPCPLCGFQYPLSEIELHASNCGELTHPSGIWVD